MNLADMLCYADIAELTAIAEAYDCDCSSHSKNELIQSILSKVQRRDVMESRVGEMTGNDLRFLNSLVFENRTAYSLEELKARAMGGEPASAQGNDEAAGIVPLAAPSPATVATKTKTGNRSRKGKSAPPKAPPGPDETARMSITRFKRFGWLFSGFSQQTRYLYQVPEDVKVRLSDALEKRFRGSLVVMEEPPVYRDESNLLAEDCVHFLRYVRENDIPLTSEGVMYKRQIALSLEQLSVGETIPTRGGWRFGYGRKFRDYPDRFSLLYDFVFKEGYVVEQPDRLTLTEAGRSVADGGEKPDPAKVYRCWLRIYKGPIPNLHALVQWIMRLTTEWATVESVFRILQPLVRSYYYDTQRDVLERRILHMLMHLGIIRWGETAEGINVVKLTLQGQAFLGGKAQA